MVYDTNSCTIECFEGNKINEDVVCYRLSLIYTIFLRAHTISEILR